MTKKYIVSREKYTDKAGVEKSSYHRVGEILTFPSDKGDRQVIKMYMSPSESFYIQEPREDENKGQAYAKAYQGNTGVQPEPTQNYAQPEPKQDMPTINTDDEEINLEDVPF